MKSLVDWQSAWTGIDWGQKVKLRSLEENLYLWYTLKISRPIILVVADGVTRRRKGKAHPLGRQ